MRENLVRNTIRNHMPMVVLLCAVSCVCTEPTAPRSVSRAWQEHEDAAPIGMVNARDKQKQTTERRPASVEPAAPDPIVSVNGHPIAAERVINLLLRGHGPALVEQLAVLDMAERLAAQRGLSITAEDIERETEYALRRLVDPSEGMPSQPFDREEAERVLETVLARRNISREEFRLTIRRNATLRRIVEADQVITESRLRNEFLLLYGSHGTASETQHAAPAEQVTFESVRADLEWRIRRRLAEPAMQSLHENLFRSANIEVHHPALRAAFSRMQQE